MIFNRLQFVAYRLHTENALLGVEIVSKYLIWELGGFNQSGFIGWPENRNIDTWKRNSASIHKFHNYLTLESIVNHIFGEVKIKTKTHVFFVEMKLIPVKKN